VIVGLLGYTGWLGGELVYHHRIGVMDPKAEPEHLADTADSRPEAASQLRSSGRT
jgi:hypothetical protein